MLIRKIIAAITGTALASIIPTIVFLAKSDVNNGLFTSFLLIFYMYSFFAISIIGVPSFIVLRRLGLANLWSAIILGLLSGALISVALGGLKNITVQNLVLLGSTGSVAAVVFWFTWVLFKPAKKST